MTFECNKIQWLCVVRKILILVAEIYRMSFLSLLGILLSNFQQIMVQELMLRKCLIIIKDVKLLYKVWGEMKIRMFKMYGLRLYVKIGEKFECNYRGVDKQI
ncbi:cysteine-rich hydrophobic domain 2 protein isoformX2 [Platysternon megacephalum]|uniref:Cysteine-rich hydrophobic domain 2 protein isoformX2 n=1 Tax=Platysternon megacephalum TaxID=55544 RepID=A0A4D9FCJ4_9SAUR|nr:cysteine-rich hydrophobic domain 2 protein isoformX2 [Platysternon megacephalum]